MSQVQIGNRVAINSFKFKGQEGTVKFIGEVEDKGIGLWLPKGDMDGTISGKHLFECNASHGLLLRSTQVKVLGPAQPVPELKIGGGNGAGDNISDSPLLTPKDPPLKQLMNQLVAGGNKPVGQPKPQTDAPQNEGATGGDAKPTANWRDRLENLRKQKELKKQTEDQQVQDHEETKETSKIKQSFAPAAGITRNKDGTLGVKQEEAKSALKIRQEQQAAEQAAKEQQMEQEAQQEAEEQKKKQAAQQSATASKIGGALKQAVGSRLPGAKAGATTTATKQTAAEIAKEKLMKKNEEVKAKLDSRQSETTRASVGGAGATGLQKQGTLVKGRMTARGDPEDKKEETKSKLEDKVGAGLKLGGLRKPGAIGGGTKDAVADKAKEAVNDIRQAATSATRPLTARGAVKEEEKKDVKKTTLGAKRNESSTTRSKIGGHTGKDDSTSAMNIAKKNTIIEEEDEQPLAQVKSMPSRSPLKSAAKAKEEKVEIHPHPTQIQQHNVTESMAAAFGGVSQAEYKKLEADLRKKKEDVFALQMEVKDLSTKITDLQKEHADKLEELKTEYEIKILELETKLGDNSLLQTVENEHKLAMAKAQTQFQEQMSSLQSQLEEAKKAHITAQQQVAEKTKLLEAAEVEKKRLQTEVDARIADIEIIQLEMEALRDEKEELLNQIKMSSEVQDQSALAGLSEDELKSQNQKLRQAISTLTMNFEIEKSKYQTKIAELETRAKLVDDYEKKLEDMDLLIEEVELKDQEIKAMEEKVDECLEFEKMVEEMAEELLKKEEENEELVEKIQELEEMNAVQEELNENQEQYIKELNEDIANKDAEIFNFEQNIAQLEEMVLEQDQKIQKYKERCNELNSKSKMLQEELQSAYAAGDQKVKISTLIEKQNQLIGKLREAGKKDLEIMVHKIEFWQEKLKIKVIEGFIPQRLTEETRLDSLEKIQLLNKTKNKALLLTREICEKQIQNSEQLHEDKDQWTMFVKLLVNISENSIKFIDVCNRIMICIYKMPIDKYQEITKLSAWNKFTIIDQFIDKLMELLKDEALIPKFDIQTYVQTIKQISDLQYTVESRYIEKTKDERIEEEKTGEKAFDLSIAQQDRQRDIKQCYKLNLRNECLKMALAIIALSSLNSNKTEETVTKCKLIYWRLLDIIFKVDSIDGQDNGGEYLNLNEIGTDSRLEQKFNNIRALWATVPSGDPQSEASTGEPQERDWTYVLEAIERDITTLNNDYKFKKLSSKIEDEFRNQQIHIDDIYSKGWDNKGPWTLIVDKIRQDLQDTGLMKDKIEKLEEKVKDQAMQYLMLKREKEEMHTVNSALEKRLGDAISKAEKVPALEMEKKRLQEKEQYFTQQMEVAKKEIENMREKEKEMTQKLQDFENNPMLARESFKNLRKQTTVTSTTNQSARQQRTSQYFQKLAQSNFLGHKRESMAQGRSTTSKQLQVTEEIFTNVIMELQKDRLALKGQQMTERLNKLCKSEGAFNQYLTKQKEQRDLMKRLTKDEQGKIEDALENVEVLKSKVKKEMALIKVIDLTKKDQMVEKQKGEEFIENNREKINYMIVKAKDQVNDAFKILFSKDSKLNSVKSIKDIAKPSEEKANIDIGEKVVDDEKIKIGSIRINGLPPLKKVVNLNPLIVNELKTNLTVFAQ